jgi:FkbM family methyltransferase
MLNLLRRLRRRLTAATPPTASTNNPMDAVPTSFLSNENTMLAALIRCRNQGTEPMTLVDIGAASGDWTRTALAVWPTANVLMLEPLNERQPELSKMCRENPRIFYQQAAAGEKHENRIFTVTEDLDGSGFYDSHGQDPSILRHVNVVTVDSAMTSNKLEGPFLLKFDTHGYELPILRGASNTLDRCLAIVMECYGFPIAPECKMFGEMCLEMQCRGFRLSDIVDVTRRSKDNIFWQCDAVFLQSNHPHFKNNDF